MQHSIAIDAMGGDYGIKVTVPASIQILQRFPEINIIIKETLKELFKKKGKLLLFALFFFSTLFILKNVLFLIN